MKYILKLNEVKVQEASNKHIELLQDVIKGLRAEIEILKQANKNDLLPLVIPRFCGVGENILQKSVFLFGS